MRVLSELNNKNSELIAELNLMIKLLAEDVFGLLFVTNNDKPENEIPANVVKLAQNRWEAKQNRDWEMADKLRNEVKELGYVIVDKKDGFDIEKIK